MCGFRARLASWAAKRPCVNTRLSAGDLPVASVCKLWPACPSDTQLKGVPSCHFEVNGCLWQKQLTSVWRKHTASWKMKRGKPLHAWCRGVCRSWFSEPSSLLFWPCLSTLAGFMYVGTLDPAYLVSFSVVVLIGILGCDSLRNSRFPATVPLVQWLIQNYIHSHIIWGAVGVSRCWFIHGLVPLLVYCRRCSLGSICKWVHMHTEYL